MIRLGKVSLFLPLLLLLVFTSLLYASPQHQTVFTMPPLRREIMTLQSMYRLPTHSSRLLRTEIPAIKQASASQQTFSLQPVPGTAYRPTVDQQAQLFAMKNQLLRQTQQSTWLEPIAYPLPDVSDHASVLALAEMSYNAYTELGKDGQWYDLGSKWRINSTFGWESDGLRGHVFGNTDDSHLIISFKGTSAALFNGEPTGERDKFNDNMLFSCCCGKVNRGWKAICECNDDSKQYVCDNQCLDKNLLKSELYYDYAAHMYMDVADRYPNATIWLTGHSLGGAIATLLGQTFGVPAVSFESPGNRLAAQRLHLPKGPGAANLPIWHFGHTADPVFIGVCTGPTSGCFYAGFAMETACHTGKVCVWDTVKDNGWRINVAYHRVATVIESILKKPEEFPVPVCKEEVNCDDCGLWTFYDSRD